MSSVKDIQAAIPKLSSSELAELRAWLESYFQHQPAVANESFLKRKRSALRLRPLQGQWIGEIPLKSGHLAEELFSRQ